ncbi:MAG: hypothetical protein ABIP94_15035 [Planctomycetota bacterium]
MYGASATSYAGLPLPVLLDPLFGTNQCRLYTSFDCSLATVSAPGTPALLQYGFVVPLGASGATIHLQHVCLQPVPGGMSWSNRVTLHVQ